VNSTLSISSLQQRARRIELASRRLVDEQLAGQYQSLFKGRGVIFSDVRPYSPGDDVRSIDWNVSARMNATHVKQFVEERDRTVNLVVDMSASSLWGSVGLSKRDMAAELAAVVAFAAIKNHDRVGLYIVTDRVELFVQPKKGRRHVMRLVAEILGFQPKHRGSSLAAGLDTLNKVCPRRSVLLVVSDFLGDASASRTSPSWESSLRIAAQRHDVIAAVITDRAESTLPDVGLLAVEDLESGAIELVDTSAARKQYLLRTRQWQQARDASLRRAGVETVTISTEQEYLSVLVRFLRERAQSKARKGRR
jgi:uncharacterized protein (DUF58 family)